jgi:CRISPR/Cas system endoribonuclease Cas6 (RAMP superfamily)
MEHYILVDYWGSLVRAMKDSEKKEGIDHYMTEKLANEFVDYIRYTRIRQYNLFMQQRGEDFERMIAKLTAMGFEEGAIQRYLANEELWKVTLQMGEQ